LSYRPGTTEENGDHRCYANGTKKVELARRHLILD